MLTETLINMQNLLLQDVVMVSRRDDFKMILADLNEMTSMSGVVWMEMPY